MNNDSKITVAITGINGFVGHHLCRELVKAGANVIGLGMDESASEGISQLLTKYYRADLTKQWPVEEPVNAVIHLAGLSAVGPSYDKPQLYIEKNSAMVTNLCEYYVNQPESPRIVLVSSGAIYDGKQPMPISEDGNLGYSSPYAISKITNESQAKYYNNRGLSCVVARPFNHIGPGQLAGFILPDLCSKTRQALGDGVSSISAGNLKTKRDYTDVRDIVRAYVSLALAEKLNYDVYNIASGKSVSGEQLFALVQDKLGAKNISANVDQSLVRPGDIMDIQGDSGRLAQELNWQPTYSLNETVSDFIDAS